MALTGSEFRGPLGLVVDATGALVTVASGSSLGGVVPGWLTDSDGRLVVAASGMVFPGPIPGIPANSLGAVVTGSSDGTPFGSRYPGYLANASGALVTSSGPVASMLSGMARDASGALVMSGGAQLVLSPLAADNFDRANGAIAGANNWLATGDPSPLIASNQLTGTAGTLTSARRSEVFGSDQYSRAVMGSTVPGHNEAVGLTVRNQDAANCYLAFVDGETAGNPWQLAIYKKVAGTLTNLLTTSIGNTAITAGTTFTFVAEGSQLTLLTQDAGIVVGVSIADATFTGGAPGILDSGLGTIDNWDGGNAATAALPAATATDNFNRANGDISTGHPEWLSLAGTVFTGTPCLGLTITTNQLVTTGATHNAEIRTDAFGSDHWSAVQMGGTFPDSVGFVGALARLTGNSGYLGCIFQPGAGSTNPSYRIYRLDSGSSTAIASAVIYGSTAPDPAGTVYTLVAKGSRLSFRRNGAEVLSAVDSTYTTGKPGLMLYPAATADNWSGGNV